MLVSETSPQVSELLPEFKRFIESKYRPYNYIGLTESELAEIILSVIMNIELLKIKDSKLIEKRMNVLVAIKMFGIIQEKLKNNSYRNNIICGYIDSNFIPMNNNKACQENINKLHSFFNLFGIIPSTNLFKSLIINNSKIKELAEFLYQKTMVKKTICITTETSIKSYLLRAYCLLNNIRIEEIDDEGPKSIKEMYLAEIIRYPLLKFIEEQYLFSIIYNPNSSLSEKKRAKDTLINCNLRLVVSIANNYTNNGIDFLDLIQYGTEGLIKAIEKYKYPGDNKLSTYAIHWITATIARSVDSYGTTVEIPAWINEMIRQYNITYRKLCESLKREPTNEELCEELKRKYNWDKSDYAIVEEARKASNDISIYTELGEHDEKVAMVNLLPSYEPSPEDIATTNQYYEDIYIKFWKSLKDQEKKVYELYYMEDGEYTLEMIGEILGISRSYVHVMVKSIREKLSKAFGENVPYYIIEYLQPPKKKESKSTKTPPKKASKDYTLLELDYLKRINATEEEVLICFPNLPKDDQDLINKRYGGKNIFTSKESFLKTEKERNRFHRIIKKLANMILRERRDESDKTLKKYTYIPKKSRKIV